MSGRSCSPLYGQGVKVFIMEMVKDRKKYRTVVLSDIHLGTIFPKVVEVGNFLSSAGCDRLIFNGDVFDSITSNFDRMLADMARAKGCDGGLDR